MRILAALVFLAFVCGISSLPLFKRNLELLDMMKTPLLMTYREHVPENQLYYLTQLHDVPTHHYFRRDSGVVPRI
ncbi:hypothetical protein OESDEN_12240 [Oesophagostomum dentatum]|uniref:Uncharacterized protein n=1 Tax=Oesophagostomum dentatum TaxID=61180 RepID=A0A0B1SWS6_OESDE|nr:hypothetical protein OESDEN_12240 [Oesophagostomum dentatum]